MKRLIVITGPRGSGKTTLAATLVPPSQVDTVYYHDSENSANAIVEQMAEHKLAFGRYVSLNDRWGNLPPESDLLNRITSGRLPWVDTGSRRTMEEYYKYILEDLERNLEPNKYGVYIHDTLEKLEAGMAAWVDGNRKQAGVTTLAHGRLWTEGVFPLYEQLLSALFARGVHTVILTSHLKTPWEDNRPMVGKVTPSGKKLLYRLSSLMLWLINDGNNADGAPAALVLKERMGKLTVEDGQWVPRRMLPARIPHCTWTDIDRYMKQGCDLSNPAPGETPSAKEREMISELLTDEQMRLMILSAEKDLVDARGENASVLRSDADEARAMAEAGADVREIAESMGKPKPLVKRWLAGEE